VYAQTAPPKQALTVDRAIQSVLGKKVRITAADGTETVGQAVSASATQLELSGATRQQIPFDVIRRIELEKSKTGGMMWGILVGGGGGVALGALSAATSDATKGAGTIVGMAAGLAGLGGLMGYALSGGRTLVYSSSTVSASIHPQLGRHRLGVTLQLRW
jgi:hypothetical protein